MSDNQFFDFSRSAEIADNGDGSASPISIAGNTFSGFAMPYTEELIGSVNHQVPRYAADPAVVLSVEQVKTMSVSENSFDDNAAQPRIRWITTPLSNSPLSQCATRPQF